MKMSALDSIIRKLYEAKSGLVNKGAESLQKYGLVHAILDIRKLSIIRSSKLLRPDSFDTQSRPSNLLAFNARSLATNTPKKRRSRGKGRKARGLPPHPIPPPSSPKPKCSKKISPAEH